MTNSYQRLAAEIKMESGFPSKGSAALIALILTADQARRSFDAAIAAKADLTQQQYNVLRILRGAGAQGLPLLEVGERMIQQSPGMTRMMDRLAKKGLIDRVRGVADRRQVHCILTESGHKLLCQLDPIVEAFNQRIEEALGDTQQEQFLHMLEGIRHTLKSTSTPNATPNSTPALSGN